MIYRCDETETKVKRMIKEIMNDAINEYEVGFDFNKQNMPAYALRILDKLEDRQQDCYSQNVKIMMTVEDLVEYSHFLIQSANEANDRNARIEIKEDDKHDYHSCYDKTKSPYYAVLTDSTGKTLSFSDYRLQHTTIDDD